MILAGIILLSIGGGVLVLIGLALAFNYIWHERFFDVEGTPLDSILCTISFVALLIFLVGIMFVLIECGG